MIGSSRLIKIIFLTLGVYLIAINIILWANGEDLAERVLTESSWMTFNGYQNQRPDFKGFHWFFNELSTFHGVKTTMAAFNKYINIFNQHWTENIGENIGTGFLWLLQVIFAPMMFLGTTLIDIFTNAAWFFHFLYEIAN